MYNIIITHKAEYLLDAFINAFRNIFYKIYSDTGIVDEGVILENYRKTAKNLKESILDKINYQLSQETVYGRKINEDNSYTLLLRERNFIIILDYTEDITTQTRYIENIEITKKT